jgi:hypothetical protein
VTIRALNRWRLMYLGEALLHLALPPERAGLLRATLLLGGVLWLLHDLAHGRWRIAAADGLALGTLIASTMRRNPHHALSRCGRRGFVVAVAYAASHPEQEPSPHLWSAVRHSG